MCQFVETIRVEKGVAANLPFHEVRLNETIRQFRPQAERIALGDLLHEAFRYVERTKARVVYDANGVVDLSFAPYALREIRTLKIVHSETIDYHLKSTDRSALGELLAQRGACDEVIIVKNGRVTDSSFSNVAFFDGEGWTTPAHPLLKGTMRERLLREGRLCEGDVREGEIRNFQAVALFNAMIDLGEIVLPIASIEF